MKYVLFIVSILMPVSFIQAQIPYYDTKGILQAGGLSKDYYLPANEDIFMILGNYCSPKTTDTKVIIKNFYENPFITFDPSIRLESGITISKLKEQTFNKIGGIDVTTFAQGLSQFMINRAKLELNIAFFERFRNFLEDEPELEVIFPSTTELLKYLITYRYTEMLISLRDAFNKDLDALATNIVDLIELDRFKNVFEKYPEIAIVLRSFSLTSTLGYGWHPADIISRMSMFPELSSGKNPTLHNIYTGLRLIDILSNSLKEKEDSGKERQWITLQQFYDDIFKDDLAFKIYLGLLWQQIYAEGDSLYLNINTTKKNIADLMVNNSKSITEYKHLLLEFVNLAEQIEVHRMEFMENKKNNIQVSSDQLYGYISTSIGLLNFGIRITKQIAPDLKLDSEPYYILANESNTLFQNIYTKNFSLAIQNTSVIFSTIIDIIEKDTTKNIRDSLDDSKLFNLNNLNKLVYYGNFMANIVNATSADEVEAVITAAALPAGSSSIKKNSAFNMAVNGYLGITYNFYVDKEGKSANAWQSNFSVSAPVGIGFSTGLPRRMGSASLTGTLVDIGAIVDYQLSNDSSVIESKIKLGNIISPGAFFFYGMGWNIPLSIGIGYQYGPGLTSFDNEGKSINNKPVSRWSFIIAVDIPFFNICNIPRKKYY